jgi:hypothetical protein
VEVGGVCTVGGSRIHHSDPSALLLGLQGQSPLVNVGFSRVVPQRRMNRLSRVRLGWLCRFDP